MKHIRRKIKKGYSRHKHRIRNIIYLCLGGLIFLSGIFFIWISTTELPDFSAFEQQKMASSTKIYDRTGTVVFYNVNENLRRTVIPFDDMGLNIKNATLAIEDANFYKHHGISPKAIIRAVWVGISSGKFSQGGSTITQQIVKNALLTKEKTLTRKVKEWILAIKLENKLTKNEILEVYLNQAPYGGNIYGIEEASKNYFGKPARELTVAESAYLAAIPKGPSLYSPYGSHRDLLEERKNYVLFRQKELGMIGEEQYNQAKSEVVKFALGGTNSIKAPHFVFYILQFLEEKYGKEMVENGGLKVMSTLDAELQAKTQDLVYEYSLKQKGTFNASNGAAVIIDPKTGQVLAMVGSRDYFDKEIDGQFNVATAKRQPGSSFKPIVYVTAFKEGYTPDTILYDVPTEFNSSCSPGGVGVNCYMPSNFNDKVRGPMKLRDALQQSINIPAVKLLYLVGIDDAIKTATDMGITSLVDKDRFGLSLVLGGGEVSPLEMTSAYSVLASNGIRHPYKTILKIEDGRGAILEEYKEEAYEVLPKNAVLTLHSVLSDNNARIPTFGANSPMFFPDRQVAVKTGTTNNFKDVWTIGYTPSITVGVWVGNNDNTPMRRIVSGPSAAAMWRAIMDEALKKVPVEDFEQPEPDPEYASLKPILRGDWQTGGVHSILYWVNKDNPRGDGPKNPYNDPQFKNWEAAVQSWGGWSGGTNTGDGSEAPPPDFINGGIESPLIPFINE